MRVQLGHFARSGIEAHLGADLAGGVQAALRHYWRRLRSGTSPVELPRGSAEPILDRADAGFELPVEREIRLSLESEAERQATTVDRVLAHAVLVYLADLDASAGRAEGSAGRAEGRGNGLSPR